MSFFENLKKFINRDISPGVPWGHKISRCNYCNGVLVVKAIRTKKAVPRGCKDLNLYETLNRAYCPKCERIELDGFYPDKSPGDHIYYDPYGAGL